jgi:hypothetical protein
MLRFKLYFSPMYAFVYGNMHRFYTDFTHRLQLLDASTNQCRLFLRLSGR